MMIAAAFAFAACGGENPEGTDEPAKGTQLEAPVLEIVEVLETSFTVRWEAVAGADSYSLNMKGDNYTTEELTYTFENLNAGEYSVRVKASGKGFTDSKYSAAVVATITGATSVDWFEQTLTLAEEDAENGIFPYNAVDFTWKGTGVKDLNYGLFETAALEGASDKDIIANLNTLGRDANEILSLVNGEGFGAQFTGLMGSTSYTMCTWVKNGAGQEFLAKAEVTTTETVIPEETKAWLGDWTAYTEKTLDIAQQTYTIVDERRDFTLTITSIPGYTHEVFVDGFSEMGAGLPMQATVEGNMLGIWNQVVVQDLGEGWYATWLSVCGLGSGGYTWVTGQYPTYLLEKAADGSITCTMYKGELQSGDTFTALGMDIIGLNFDKGELSLLSDPDTQESYSIFKIGEIKGMTKAAAPTAKVFSKKQPKFVLGEVLPASIVY